jgi:hypothetical protein
MPTRPTQQPLPDLFAPAATETAAPENQVVAPRAATAPVGQPLPTRHLLPKNLPAALSRLDDAEFDALLTAVIDEAKRRRDRMPSRLTVKSQEPGQRRHDAPKSGAPETPAALHPRQTRTNDDEPALTPGQMNAVRAAFKAGVKPSMIARKFGISQSNVRRALASDVRQRKLQ